MSQHASRPRSPQEAKAEAEAAARVRPNSLANMSHEIRTPLNAIIGFAHLLQKSELSTGRPSMQRLRASGNMLLQLINDILDFSKIEAGRMSIEKAPFVLDAVLDNLSGMVAERAREKGWSCISCSTATCRSISSAIRCA